MATSSKKYTVRPGVMDMGKEYEIQMAALLSLRCVLSAEEDMWLASNPDGVGALDDIIVNVKRPGGSTLTYMLQMKHKEKPTPITEDEYRSSNIKHQYRLVKYYTDIDSLKTSMGSTSTKKEIIKGLGKFHHIYFLLFTNRPTESCAFLKSVDEKHHVRSLSFVNTSDSTKSNAYIFDTKQLPTTICKDKKIKFYLLTNQVHGNSLNVTINQELVRIVDKLGLNNVNCKEVSEKYIKFITQWAKGHLGGHYCLTLKDVLSKLASLLLSQYEFNLVGRMFQTCTSEGNSTWNELIQEKSIIIVDSTELVQEFLIGGIANEVVQHCNNCNKPFKSWTDSFDTTAKQWFYKTHTNLETEMFKIVGKFGTITLLDLYKCLWKVERCPLILQICKEEEYESIISILKLSARHPKVVIVNKIDNFSPKSKTGVDLFSSLQDLGEDQRQTVLDNIVKIQGRNSAKLKDLLDETMFGHITSKDIIYILSNQFNVGGKQSELHPFFIERSVMKVFLKAKVLEEVRNEIFLLSDYSGNHGYQALEDVDLTNLTNEGIFTISKVESTKTLKSIPKRIIHCLSVYDENLLEWRWSSGTTKSIRPFRDYIDTFKDDSSLTSTSSSSIFTSPYASSFDFSSSFYESNMFTISSSCITKNKNVFRKFTDVVEDKQDFEVATNIISDVPGMGKSVLMNFVALNAPPSHWVLIIELQKHQKYYRKLKNSKSNAFQHLSYVYEALLSKDQFNSELNKMIFQKLATEKNVLVILDGFDEIPICYKDEVTNMAKCLQAAGFKLWLTTRPHMKGYLEEEFDTFATSLKSFTFRDQTKYLIEYFSEKTPNSEESPTEFVKELLQTVRYNLRDWEGKLTGIPLQTSLLANYFTAQWNKVAYTGMRGSFIEKVNLMKLYRSFIDKQFDRLCKKLGEEQISDTYPKVVEHQKLLALQLVFSSERFGEIDIIKDLNEYYTKNPSEAAILQRDGIMTITEKGDLSCIHQTFAEYLAAEWLRKNVSSSDLQVKELSISLIKKRFTGRHNFLFHILDLLVTQNCPLHTAILERQMSDAERMIKEKTDKAVFAKDKFKRSVLHVLTICCSDKQYYGDNSIDYLKLIQDLPVTHRGIYSEADIIEYTPLDYELEWRTRLGFADVIYTKMNYSVISAHISITADQYSLSFTYRCSLFHTLLPYFISRWLLLNYLQGNLVEKHMDKNTNVESYLNEMNIHHSKGVTALEYLQSGEARLYSGYSNNYYQDIRFALAFGSRENIATLLSQCVEVNKQDVDGNTVLHFAVALGDIEIIKELLSKGALSYIENIYSVTPLDVAKIKQHSLALETLLSSLLNSGRTYAGKKSLLHYAVEYGCCQDVKKVLNDSVVNKTDDEGNTPLHAALSMAEFDMAKLLLDNGSDVNLQNFKGETPVHLAIKRGMPGDSFRLLLSNARVDIQDIMGDTALHVAVKRELSMGSLGNSTDKNYTPNIAKKSPFHIFSNMWVPYLLCLDCGDEDKYGEESDNDVFRLLINKGIDVNVKNVQGDTALHTSIRGGDFSSVRKILSKSALVDINHQDEDGNTYLHLALKLFHFKIISSLIVSGIDLNIQNNERQTALHISATRHYYITCLLLRFGSDIDAKDRDGNTALHLALDDSCMAIADLLLSTQASINIKNRNGDTALHYAWRYGPSDIFDKPRYQSVDLNVQNKYGDTPLHIALNYVQREKYIFTSEADDSKKNFRKYICEKDSKNIFQKHLRGNFNINIQNNNGNTVLHTAVKNGLIGIAALLLEENADINIKDMNGQSILYYAISGGYLGFAIKLVLKGADIKMQNYVGDTPLHLTCLKGCTSFANFLVSRGADINMKNRNGYTSLQYALKNGDDDLVWVILNKGAMVDNQSDESTSLHLAVREGHLDVVELLILEGASVEVADFKGYTPLHLAVIHNKVDIIRILLINGANAFKLTKWGENVLHFVEDYDTAVNFIQKGVDFNVADHRGKMPLHMAAEHNKLEIAKLFLVKGASADIQDKLGNTPLIYATRVGMLTTVTELIFQGADINKQNIFGETALTVALAKSDFLIMLVLLAFGGNINFNNEQQKAALRDAMDMVLSSDAWNFRYESRYRKKDGISKYQATMQQWESLLNVLMIERPHDPSGVKNWISISRQRMSYNDFHYKVVHLFARKGITLRDDARKSYPQILF